MKNKTFLYQIAIFPTAEYQELYLEHKSGLEKLWKQIFGRQKLEIIQFEMAGRYVRFMVKLPQHYHRIKFVNTPRKFGHKCASEMCPEAQCVKDNPCWELTHWFKSAPNETYCYALEISNFIQNKLERTLLPI